jgi:hypothetical protein
MKWVIPYPLLFITAIVLDRVVISSTEIGISQSLRALLVLLLATIIITLIGQAFTKDWHRTHFLVLMIIVYLIAYRSLYRLLKINFSDQINALGLALMILLGIGYVMITHRRIWGAIRNPVRISAYFSLVFIVLLGFQIFRLGSDGYHVFTNIGHAQTKAVSNLDEDIALHEGVSPDIYVIVLDGYARQDVLQSIYDFDNSKFIDSLEKRGFYVARESHSNYVQTPYSMASFWNFDYLQPWDSSEDYAQYLFEPIQNNRVFHLLNKIGYTTVSFAGAVHFTEIKDSDVYLSNFLLLNNFETLLLVDSPVEPISNIFDLGIPTQTYKTHRQRILYQLEMLKRIPAGVSGPKIVYAHILAPHPPFVFDQNGGIRDPQHPYTLGEGAEIQGGEEKYWYGYREQVKFVNGEIIKVIDSILAKSKIPPVIVVMGDHGPGSMFHWDMDAPGCLWERTGNLYALLLPGHQNSSIVYSSISPVNTFRVIFNTYFGTDLPLLEDKSYLMIWHHPTLNIDITDRRDNQQSCTTPNK